MGVMGAVSLCPAGGSGIPCKMLSWLPKPPTLLNYTTHSYASLPSMFPETLGWWSAFCPTPKSKVPKLTQKHPLLKLPLGPRLQAKQLRKAFQFLDRS